MKRPRTPPGVLLLRVGPAEAGLRLDVFLSRRLHCSRSQIVRRLAGKVHRASGRTLKWSQQLAAGLEIQVQGRPRPEPDIEVRYRLLFQDDSLLAVDKAAGVPVHPVRSFRTRTLVTRLRAEQGDDTLAPAHRLDRETSGVVVFGRGPGNTRRLMEQFAGGSVRKDYLAVVRGRPDFEQVVVDVPLGRDDDFPVPCRMRVAERGRRACTEVRVLWRGPDRALLLARPRSGRQHQIRVHLAHLGHPVLGDKLYQDGGSAYLKMLRDELDDAAREQLGHGRQALHAWSLRLRHPGDGRPLHLLAAPPADLLGLLPARAWRQVDLEAREE